MDKYSFPCNPVANPTAVISGPRYRFTLLSDIVLRYEWAEDGVFEDRASAFAINRNFTSPKFSARDTGEHLDIRSSNFQITYDKKRFSPSGFVIGFSSKVTLWGSDWHFGETAKDNLGGTARTLDDVDGRCDMGSGVLSRSGFSTIDDSETMLFDGQGFVSPRRSGDRIDGYMFCYGHDYKAAMTAFYDISGRQPAIPRWALGNWWSRYHPYTAHEYTSLMDKFKDHHIPLSVAVIDMDWHQVKGDHIPHAGWTGYTWNKDLVPSSQAFMKALHDRGLRVTLNDHPHAGVHHHEDLYEAMAEAVGHDASKKAPILFDPTSPKFMHASLNVLHRSLENEGCDFWWIDWQQGPTSRIPGLDPLWLLNYFHFQDQVNQNGEGQAMIFSRYGGPGSHRYPIGFSGDSIVTWDSLKFQPEFTATASNIGYGWWSHDIGGHMGGHRDDEMTTRWMQFGVFSPIFRLHSTNSKWMSKEPWNFRAEYRTEMQHSMQLRHRLVPYLHTMNLLAGDSPLVRPMYWEYPTIETAYQKPNEYLFGSSLIIAPVVEPRNPKTYMAKVDVWIPPGLHVDLFTGLVYDGDRALHMYRSLQSIPALMPMGAMLPLDGNNMPGNGCKNPNHLEVIIIIGQDGVFTILEDPLDDEEVVRSAPASGTRVNVRNTITLDYEQSTGRMRILASAKAWTFRFLGFMERPSSLEVRVAGNLVTAKAHVDQGPQCPGLVISTLRPPTGTCAEVEITLGPNPQLSIVDKQKRISEFLLAAQIDYAMKDRLFDIVNASNSLGSKVGSLLALGLEEDVVGPVLEILTADSR